MGGRFWRDVRKRFALDRPLSAVPESRPQPRIPAGDGLLCAMLMFLVRRKSLLGASGLWDFRLSPLNWTSLNPWPPSPPLPHDRI